MAAEEGMASNGAELAADAASAAVDQPETPAKFLTDLSDALKGTDDVDAELAGIIADHLLIVSPDSNAVFNAKAAIVEIASQRATADATEDEDTSNG